MTDFNPKYEYVFTGPANLIEMVPRHPGTERNHFLGHFIQYKSVVHHGDIYNNGKAEFQFGIVNLGHYDFVENYAVQRTNGTA